MVYPSNNDDFTLRLARHDVVAQTTISQMSFAWLPAGPAMNLAASTHQFTCQCFSFIAVVGKVVDSHTEDPCI